MLFLLLLTACDFADTRAQASLVTSSPQEAAEVAAQVVDPELVGRTKATARAEGVLVHLEVSHPTPEVALDTCRGMLRTWVEDCNLQAQGRSSARVQALTQHLEELSEGSEAWLQAAQELKAAQLGQAMAQCEVRVLDDCRVGRR